MGLPDERVGKSASSLIQQFQSRIEKSSEAPLVPVASLASPAKPRLATTKDRKEFAEAPGLGNGNDDLRRLLELRKMNLGGKSVGEMVVVRSAGLPAPLKEGDAAGEKQKVLVEEGEGNLEGENSATENLDNAGTSKDTPSQISTPPPSVSSPLQAPIEPNPLGTAEPLPSPSPSIATHPLPQATPSPTVASTPDTPTPRSPPLIALESTLPSSTIKPRSSSSASTGPAGPTTSSLAKSRSTRVGSPVLRSESAPSPTQNQKISTSITPSSPISMSSPSHSQSPTVPSNSGRSDASSPRSRRGSPIDSRNLSTSLGTDGFERTRSSSSGSTNGKRSPAISGSVSSTGSGSFGGGAGPRKVVATTGTPRSRAAAAAAAALAAQSSTMDTSPGIASPAKSPVVKKPSSLVKKTVSSSIDGTTDGSLSTPPRLSHGIGRIGLAGASKPSSSPTSSPSPHSSPLQTKSSASSPVFARRGSTYDETDPITEHSPSLNFRTPSSSQPVSPTARSAERLSPRLRESQVEGGGGEEGMNEAFNFKGFAGRILPGVEGAAANAGAGRRGGKVEEEGVGLGIASPSHVEDLPEIQ